MGMTNGVPPFSSTDAMSWVSSSGMVHFDSFVSVYARTFSL
jgi:hypothetical protein